MLGNPRRRSRYLSRTRQPQRVTRPRRGAAGDPRDAISRRCSFVPAADVPGPCRLRVGGSDSHGGPSAFPPPSRTSYSVAARLDPHTAAAAAAAELAQMHLRLTGAGASLGRALQSVAGRRSQTTCASWVWAPTGSRRHAASPQLAVVPGPVGHGAASAQCRGSLQSRGHTAAGAARRRHGDSESTARSSEAAINLNGAHCRATAT